MLKTYITTNVDASAWEAALAVCANIRVGAKDEVAFLPHFQMYGMCWLRSALAFVWLFGIACQCSIHKSLRAVRTRATQQHNMYLT